MFQKRPVNPVHSHHPIQPGSEAPFAKPGLLYGFDEIISPIVRLAKESHRIIACVSKPWDVILHEA
ncbi:MAG TPA: hypothetical protein VGN87_16630 [Paenibacillus sp.]|jgi:hypothetical protein